MNWTRVEFLSRIVFNSGPLARRLMNRRSMSVNRFCQSWVDVGVSWSYLSANSERFILKYEDYINVKIMNQWTMLASIKFLAELQ